MCDAYLVDVTETLESLGTSTVVSGELGPERLRIGGETFVPAGPAHFDVTITNTGTAVVVVGTACAPVAATCVRCLAEFPTEIAAQVDGFYVRPGHEEAVPEDEEIEYIDAENRIDLLPAISTALMLEAPFAPLHDESCAGLCPTCGANLNEGPCDCDSDDSDSHPFGALRELMGEANASGD